MWTTVTIPDGVTRVGAYAFDSTLASVARVAFTSIDFPDSVEFVGEFAFPGALSSSVTTLDLRNSSITHISNHAFANNNLETVYLPESIEFVHAEAFAGNPGTDGEGADLPGSSGIQTLYETSFPAHCLYRLADGHMFMFNGCESINENDFGPGTYRDPFTEHSPRD